MTVRLYSEPRHSRAIARECPCGFGGWPKFTADWCRRHLEHHVATFPHLLWEPFGTSIRALRECIEWAERVEAEPASAS